MDQIQLYPSFVMLCAERSEEEQQEAMNKSKVPEFKSPSKSTVPNGQSALQSNLQGNRFKSTIFDCKLSNMSQNRNSRLKEKIKDKLGLFDLVLVSPLFRAVQTYVSILGENSQIRVVIEPLLAPQLTCAGAIGKPTKQVQEMIKGKLDLHKVEGKMPWYLSNLPTSVVQELQIKQEKAEQICLQILKTKEIESNTHFQERIDRLKTALVGYKQTSKKKILIVSHSDVLETLTATCIAQDGSLVNHVPFSFGEAKQEYIVLPETKHTI